MVLELVWIEGEGIGSFVWKEVKGKGIPSWNGIMEW